MAPQIIAFEDEGYVGIALAGDYQILEGDGAGGEPGSLTPAIKLSPKATVSLMAALKTQLAAAVDSRTRRKRT